MDIIIDAIFSITRTLSSVPLVSNFGFYGCIIFIDNVLESG